MVPAAIPHHLTTITNVFSLIPERAVAPGPVIHEPVVMNVPNIPLPVVYVPMVNQNEIFVAGFRDCSQEAVRYLVEEERLSMEDPIITGLQEYLRDRETVMDVPAAISQHALPPMNYYPQYQYYPYYYPHHDVTMDNHKPHYQVAPPPCPVFDDSVTSSMDDSVMSLDDSMTSSVCDIIDDCDKDSGVSVSEDELAAGAMELNQLAQNNPGIGKLLTELFELFEEESDDDYDDDDDMDL